MSAENSMVAIESFSVPRWFSFNTEVTEECTQRTQRIGVFNYTKVFLCALRAVLTPWPSVAAHRSASAHGCGKGVEEARRNYTDFTEL